jgi:hypothetical protein
MELGCSFFATGGMHVADFTSQAFRFGIFHAESAATGGSNDPVSKRQFWLFRPIGIQSGEREYAVPGRDWPGKGCFAGQALVRFVHAWVGAGFLYYNTCAVLGFIRPLFCAMKKSQV